jgi:hypothetical protein
MQNGHLNYKYKNAKDLKKKLSKKLHCYRHTSTSTLFVTSDTVIEHRNDQ